MKIKKEKLFIIISAVILLLTAFFSLRYGSAKLTLAEFFSAFKGNNTSSVIVFQLRLPRLLAGILSGIALSVAGTIIQALTDNDMASPSIVGVNSGAGLMVIFFVAFINVSAYFLPVFAFIGAFLASLFITALSRKMGLTKSSIILTGLAINAVFSAGISFISLIDESALVSYHAFSVGSLSLITYGDILVPSIIIVTGVILALLISKDLTIIRMGDTVAGSLGVRVKRVKVTGIIITSMLSASAVSICGLLGFVGLIAPHLAKLFVGGNLKKLIPASALTGSILVTLSDFLGKIIFAPSDLPVGIIMALIGAPFFLILLVKGGAKNA
ncbi:MAG: iron ABC transporter permease [Clostridia bacterium]|nr:iron ABC transporter permease [Clostridia bacterium]